MHLCGRFLTKFLFEFDGFACLCGGAEDMKVPRAATILSSSFFVSFRPATKGANRVVFGEPLFLRKSITLRGVHLR